MGDFLTDNQLSNKEEKIPICVNKDLKRKCGNVSFCSRRRVPKEATPGGVQGEYVGMDDYGDEDEVNPEIIFDLLISTNRRQKLIGDGFRGGAEVSLNITVMFTVSSV